MSAIESDPPVKASNESNSVVSSQESGVTVLPENLKIILRNWLLATIKPLLIILKNTIIFAVFLEADRFLLWRTSLSLNDSAKIFIVDLFLQGISVISAFVVALAYVTHLTMELYKHRNDFLGIPQKPSKDKDE